MCVPYVSEYIWAYGLKWGFKWNYWATTIFAQYKDLDKIIGQLAYYYFSPIERPGTRFFFFFPKNFRVHIYPLSDFIFLGSLSLSNDEYDEEKKFI